MVTKADIEVLQEYMSSEYPNLNSGGCGLFAYIMTRHLNCQVMCLARSSQTYEKIDVDKELRTGGNVAENSSFPHVIVKYRNMYFDGFRFYKAREGVIQDESFNYHNYTIVNTMVKCEIACAIWEGNWNAVFYDKWKGDRWKAMHEIEDAVNAIFQDAPRKKKVNS